MGKTDWDAYYRHPFPASCVTRAILRKCLLRCLRDFFPDRSPIEAAELGGGGSCFMEAILRCFPVREYHVFDSNRAGLELLQKRCGGACGSLPAVHETDLLADPLPELHCDLVFSAGLIEHFEPSDTEKLIQIHFQLAGPGGIVLFLFPVDTRLYRVTRRAAELLKLWIFHDERPLTPFEVAERARKEGVLLRSKILYATPLTQCLMVFRKNAGISA